MVKDLPPVLILFDGVCNLCNGTVQFLIKRDKRRLFRYASLQSEIGKTVIRHFDIPGNMSSFLLVENGQLFSRSTAALRVAKKLEGGWKLLYALIFIPPFIRDAVYNFVGRNRYRFFGKQESCWLPSEEFKHLFLN
jgi:predicted DCC family thiol-disulfide oxidoreductase YuxK